MDTMKTEYLTLAEAAALARTSVATIRRRIASGRVRAYRRAADRALLVDRGDVLALDELRPAVVTRGPA